MHRPVRRSPSGTPASARAMWDASVLVAPVVLGVAAVLAVRVQRKVRLAVLALWQQAVPVVLGQPRAVLVARAQPRAVPAQPKAVPVVELLLSRPSSLAAMA